MPDYAKVITDVQSAVNNSGGLTICNKPTDTFDCSQDPNIGNMADSCFTASITLNTSLPIGDIHINILNCSVKSMCNMLKEETCGGLKTTFLEMPMIEMKSCDVTCCEGDLCNDPSGSVATTAATTPTVKSSAKITSIPPNATGLFATLGLFTLMSFMNLF